MKLVIHARIISYTNLSSTINEAGSLGVIGDGVISREGEVIRLLHDHWHQQPLAISGTKERVVPPPPKHVMTRTERRSVIYTSISLHKCATSSPSFETTEMSHSSAISDSL